VASIQVGVLAGNGADRQALSTIRRSRGEPSLRSWHGPSSAISRPGPRVVTERAYAHDWADFRHFAATMAFSRCQAESTNPRTVSQGLETQCNRSPAGLAVATFGLSLPTLRRRLAAIASRHATSRSQQCQHLYLG